TDADSTSLTYSAVQGPAHGALTAFDPATGAFTYAPAANYNGPDSFTFQASDGQLASNTATVSITVTAVNDAPVAQAGSLTTAEDPAAPPTPTAADVDTPTLTYSDGQAAHHVTVAITNAGTYTYTPADNYNGP